MDATNTKIIFLTGTPIINTPREIGILFNMLRGFIKTWSFTLETTTTDKISSEILMDYFRNEGLTMYDYVEYSANRLTITRNPFGFVNSYKAKNPRKKGGITKKSKKTNKRTTKKKMENIQMIKMDGEEEFPDIKENTEIEKMYRDIDRDLYEGGGAYEDYEGVHLDEMGNISDIQFERRIVKILENHGIRTIGKPVIKKETCLPDNEELFNEKFINNEKGELINIDLFKRRVLGLTSYFRSAQEQLLPSFVKAADGANYHIINIDMSDHQFETYESVRVEEREEEKKRNRRKPKTTGTEFDDKPTSTYRIYSRSACNFAFPPEYPRPINMTGKKATFDDLNGETKQMKAARDDYFEDEEEQEAAVPEIFAQQIKSTYEFLKYDPKRERAKEFLTERELGIYSPKYLQILQNIKNEENRGLHLLYSQFRTLEGVGIFKLILEANGFIEFKLVRNGQEWDIENFDVDPEKPRFVLYTGTETPEEKDIARNIYNGSWDIVPPSIVEKLVKRNPNNLYGEIIKLMMITASGAEGINLRNTRFVHIMEPYWNMVRVDQVVGRARRICSHEDLPEDLRNVKVMIYLCRATPEQIDKNLSMRTNDLSKLEYKIDVDGRVRMQRIPFTTDQYLFEIAQIKDSITRQILTSVKETAIDCSLYNTSSEEPLVCYGFGQVESQSFASYPQLERDAQERVQKVKKAPIKLTSINYQGIKYAVNKENMDVYDFASYLNAKEKKGELLKVGKYDARTNQVLFDKA